MVFPLPDGYVKRSYFSFGGLSFYTYLNATIAVGSPYVRVSLQVLPLDSTFGAGDHLDLQVFAGAAGSLQQYAFENATVFTPAGDLVGLDYDGAVAAGGPGVIVAYSNRTNVFDQDSVALRFNSSSVNTLEHWYLDPAIGGLSWVGLGYDVSETAPGTLSTPVHADVYPIQHVDFHLLSDMVAYIYTDPVNVTVSPPVGFGFIAWGLAIASHTNDTLVSLAEGYWNMYYAGYQGTEPDLAYARSVSLDSLAGFELYGGNATVMAFARHFLEAYNGSTLEKFGSSIEEFGWDTAALQTLYLYSGAAADYNALQAVEGSFVPGGTHYLGLDITQRTIPDSTFQYGEAAAGMLTGGMPYNGSAVLWAMNAVFASNASGVIENSPRHTDLANTEALPAYMLATWLFEGAMRSRTGGYWVRWTQDANLTSIGYEGGRLAIDVTGVAGVVALGTPDGGTMVFSGINGCEVLRVPPPSTFPWYLLTLLGSGAVVAALAVLLLVRAGSGKKRRDRTLLPVGEDVAGPR